MPHATLPLLFALLLAPCTLAQDGDGVRTDHIERASSAVFFYSRTESAFEVHGQIELAYGATPWTDDDTKKLLALDAGTRAPIDPNTLVTFDTSCAVAIGGEKLSPGLYFLGFERGADGLALVILDPRGVRTAHLRPSALEATTVSLSIPLTQREHGVTDHLAVTLERVRSESAAEVSFVLGSRAFVVRIDPIFEEFPAGLQVGAATYSRNCARAALGDEAKPGRIDLTYGSPIWSPALDAALDAAESGTRLRLGNNFFATLDSDCAITAGKTSVPPGHYYLALLKRGDDGLTLLFLDPAPIRAKHMNSNQTGETTGGIAIPLEWRRDQPVTEQLSIRLEPGDGDRTVILTMHFGPHEVQTTLTLGS